MVQLQGAEVTVTDQSEQPHDASPARRMEKRTSAGLGIRQRVALVSASILGPLVLIGAVAAAEGDEALPGPAEAIASAIGIGGNSGEVRNDYDNRSETAGDVGQPGSCPGQACEAPGRSAADDGGTGDDESSGDDTSDAAEAGTDDANAEDGFDPHANGKGCDDVLFAGGEPPFGGHETPVGPCNEDEEEPEGDQTAPTSPADAEGEDDENGSSGNGYGHEKGIGEGHAKGLGEGHSKHGDGTGDSATGEDSTGG